MRNVEGLFALGREAVAWFGGLAVPAKLGVVAITMTTASVGVAVVAPNAMPFSPFVLSDPVSSFAPPADDARTAAPLNPSLVASAAATSARAGLASVPSDPPTTSPTPSGARTTPSQSPGGRPTSLPTQGPGTGPDVTVPAPPAGSGAATAASNKPTIRPTTPSVPAPPTTR